MINGDLIVPLHTIHALRGVHLGIRPYTDDCHTDEFAAQAHNDLVASRTIFDATAIGLAFCTSEGRGPRSQRPRQTLAYRLQASPATGYFGGERRVVCEHDIA